MGHKGGKQRTVDLHNQARRALYDYIHASDLASECRFRPFTLGWYRELARWLQPTALATDVGAVLAGALSDELRLRQISIPALSTLEGLA